MQFIKWKNKELLFRIYYDIFNNSNKNNININ